MDEGLLLVDLAHKGEVRLARITPERPYLDHIVRFETAGLPTFTDALLRFERESGHALKDQHVTIAIAGAAIGDTIPIVRSRWNISRTGLAMMLGRPVTILNEVAAQAWATVGAMPQTSPVRGSGVPDLSVRSRHLFMTLEDGIGTAIIDVGDDRRTTVLEAEGGHLDFTPEGEVEQALCRMLAPLGGGVTFEQVLTIAPADPAWRVIGPLPDHQRQELRARILGRLAANLMLATGAWHGVLLRGEALPNFTAGARLAFDAGLTGRKSFRRLFTATRCWRVDQREPVLTGAATLMMQRHRAKGG